jgi:bifunctional DNA-binding transcriptional regulator/antitoxin component of YhaV-PrlF toxin-antitoxin module
MRVIVKATSKGQITLPSKWRQRSETHQYLLKEEGDSLVITPLEVDALEEKGWTTVFDADRDNGGKAVPIREFIKALKKSV